MRKERVILAAFLMLTFMMPGEGRPQSPSSQCPPAGAVLTLVRYAAPGGDGNGLSVGSPFRVEEFWGSAQAGSTLCLASGTYTRNNGGLLTPPAGLSGDASKAITVAAIDESDPPLFDGQWQGAPISLSQNSYWIVEGVNARSGETLIRIGENSDHNIIRRVVVWDAVWNHNNELVGIHYGSNDNLLEDIAAFGPSRKALNNTQGGDNNTYRRIWIQHQGSGDDGPTTVEVAYNSYGGHFENILASMDWKFGPETWTRTSNGTSLAVTQGGDYRAVNTNNIIGAASMNPVEECADATVYGSLAYLKSDYIFHSEGNDNHGLGAPMLYFTGYNLDCITLRHVMVYIDSGNDRYDQYRGIFLGSPSGEGTTRSWSAENLTSVSGPQGNYIDASWGVGSTISTGARRDDVASPWTATTSGANLCYQYKDGVVTNVPLWPWPMNERIKQATAMAGVYSPPSCLGCLGGRASRVAIDVTADIEAMLGVIPAQCRR
jgi:hypothetical protein